MQRAAQFALPCLGFQYFCRGACFVGIDKTEAVQLGIDLLDAGQGIVDHLDR